MLLLLLVLLPPSRWLWPQSQGCARPVVGSSPRTLCCMGWQSRVLLALLGVPTRPGPVITWGPGFLNVSLVGEASSPSSEPTEPGFPAASLERVPQGPGPHRVSLTCWGPVSWPREPRRPWAAWDGAGPPLPPQPGASICLTRNKQTHTERHR